MMPEQQNKRYQLLLENLRQSPIAIETAAANAQHYEVPGSILSSMPWVNT